MKRGVSNFGASVRARLLAVAQKENVQFEEGDEGTYLLA